MHVHAGLVVHLLIELPPIAGEEPLDIALGVGAEGEASEQRRGGDLRRPEACGGEASVDAAVRDLVEDFLRLGAVAGLFQVELERVAGELLDELGKPRAGSPSPGRCVP